MQGVIWGPKVAWAGSGGNLQASASMNLIDMESNYNPGIS